MHTRFDEVFRISLIVKAVDALAEIIGGIFLLFITPHDIESFVHWLTRSELAEDPHDFTANFLMHSVAHLSAGSTTFGAIYLLSHGVIKMFVIINVLRNKYWAYPLLIIVILGFIIYQGISLAHHFGYGLTLLTIFDIFVVVMTWFEWQKQRELRREEAESDIKA